MGAHAAQLISDLDVSRARSPLVIVRSGGGTLTPPPPSSAARRQPTLVGLGEDDDDVRATIPVLDWDTGFGESPRPRTELATATSAPRDPRRPVTLIDDVDDVLSARYRAEAWMILADMHRPRPRGWVTFLQSFVEGVLRALRTAWA